MAKQSIHNPIFGRRLREARLRLGIAQDRLGVMIGIDESCSSARISRYESGVHEPPYITAQHLATALNVPVAYFYCDDDALAKLIIEYTNLPEQMRGELLAHLDELLPKTHPQ
jgi:transcriptional regulator with XRE-family HTH domain